jgi:hypothetical protein
VEGGDDDSSAGAVSSPLLLPLLLLEEVKREAARRAEVEAWSALCRRSRMLNVRCFVDARHDDAFDAEEDTSVGERERERSRSLADLRRPR